MVICRSQNGVREQKCLGNSGLDDYVVQIHEKQGYLSDTKIKLLHATGCVTRSFATDQNCHKVTSLELEDGGSFPGVGWLNSSLPLYRTRYYHCTELVTIIY